MPNHWQLTTLGEATEVEMGQSPPGDTYNSDGDGLPFLQGSAEFGERVPSPNRWCSAPTRVAEPGDLLVSVRAPVGDTNFADARLAIGRGLARVRSTSVATSDFLRLVIQAEVGRLNQNAGGGMFASITAKNLRGFRVAIPPVTEQRRIVDLIESVDSYIDSLQTQVEANRAARSALLAELLSNPGDDWKFARLGDVSTLQIGRTPPRSEEKYWSTELERPFCTIADMNGRHCRPVREGVTELAEQEGKAKRMSAGTLLMSFKLTIGRVAFADCDLFPNEAIVSILPDRRAVTAEFLYYFLGSQDLTRESGQAVKGKTLNGASLRSIEVILPSLEEQREIINLIDAVERQIESVDSQRDAALKFRSGVLSELLSGERLLDESYDVAVSL